MEYILVILSWFVVQAWSVLKALRRNNTKFKIVLFLRETWIKVILSLTISLGVATVVKFSIISGEGIIEYGGLKFSSLSLLYSLIGGFPELLLQSIHSRLKLFIKKIHKN